jgi:hypothetical protein
MRAALRSESQNIHGQRVPKYLRTAGVAKKISQRLISLLILSFGPLSSYLLIRSSLFSLLIPLAIRDRAAEAVALDGPPQQDLHGAGRARPMEAPIGRRRA